MNIINIINDLPRNGPWAKRKCDITAIIIHHTAAQFDADPFTVAAWHMDPNRHLVDPSIAYHYYIMQDGTTYQCNHDDNKTWHAGSNQTGCANPNEYGIGVCLSGSFMDGRIPTDAQIASCKELIQHLINKHGPLDVIGHRDVAATACPGETWTNWRGRLLSQMSYKFDINRYPRPANDTGVGVHAGANAAYPLGENEGLYRTILDEMYRCGIRWVKVLDDGGSGYKAAKAVLEYGMMPVVRLYRERPYPGTLNDKQREAVDMYTALGVKYFERGNEPNLAWEWKQWPGQWTDDTFRQLVEEWMSDARYISERGGFVAIDSLSPGGDYDDITYLLKFLKQLKMVEGAATLLHDWGWISVHPAGLNHPLNYPDDPINQREHPGQTIHSHYYSDGRPTGASNCIRKWEAVGKIFYDTFGFIVPVMATEGGFWAGSRQDNRYPELDVFTASELNFRALHSMKDAPPWYMSAMFWLWSNRLFGNLAAHFERDAWKRVPGLRNEKGEVVVPEWEPAVLPLISDNDAYRDISLKLTPPPTRVYNIEDTPVNDISPVMQKMRNHIYAYPATAKIIQSRGNIFCNREETDGTFTYGLYQVPGTRKFGMTKVRNGTWEFVEDILIGEF
jgi:hypothetical protein